MLDVFHKLYMKCILLLVKAHWILGGLLQIGCRSGHQAAELVHIMRAMLGKAREWHRPVIIISVDLKKAFDAISIKALIDYVTENPMPLALQLALMRELLGPRQAGMATMGFQTENFYMTGGMRQGSPESSYLFSSCSH